MVTMKTMQLGSALLAQGYITQEKLNSAITEQKRTGRVLGQILLDNGYVSEEQLAKTISVQLNIPFTDLRYFDVDPEMVKRLTESQARQFHAIVLDQHEDAYSVGLVDPTNLRAQDELSHLLGYPIQISIITSEQYNKTVDQIYRKTEQLDEYANEVKRELETRIVDLNRLNLSIDDLEVPVIKLLQTIFEEAVEMRASDIHIEPEENKLVIRFRIDGELHPKIEADPKIAPALMVRLKLLAGLDIGEKRLPMDGRLTVKSGNGRVDVRLSTIPTQFGESVVMRLLMQNQGQLNLKKIGMPPDLLDTFYHLIKSPNGIVLVTGPTGCGKTTTLYGALEVLNQREVKILTCEDPVEYRIPGISQVQVNEKIGITFARMLRAFLRQDPDIILVGEIRDLETAQIATRAAMTGHLVLSTLHTNDAISAPGRLLDMGIPSYLIATTLRGVMSQRLLRLNCAYCTESYHPSQEELEWAMRISGTDLTQVDFRHGTGCKRCNGCGFSGRTGVFELLEMKSPLAAAIRRGDAEYFGQVARESLGEQSLEHKALALVLEGKTTIAEAMGVVSSLEI